VAVAAAAMGLVLSGGGLAFAKGKGPNKAAKRFERMAKKAYVKQQWDDAAAAFELAFQADPLAKYLFNVGRCYEKKGDLVQTMSYLRRYLAASPKAGDRAEVEALVAVVETKLRKAKSEVHVVTVPGHAVIRMTAGDGTKSEGFTPFSGWLDFGAYEAEITFDGYQPVRRTLAVRKGRTLELKLDLERTPEPEAEPEPEPEEPVVLADRSSEPAAAEPGPKPEPVDSPAQKEAASEVGEAAVAATQQAEETPAASTGNSWLPVATLSAAGAALAGGLVFGWLSREAEAEREDLKGSKTSWDQVESADASARSSALVANLLYGVGAIAAAGGGVLWLMEAESTSEVSVAPSLLPGGFGLVLQARR